MMMKKIVAVLFCLIALFVGCDQGDKYKKPDDPLEAGRDFIRFALDGNMQQAKTFILNDGTNNRLFDKISKKYDAAPRAEKEAYKNASIRIIRFQKIDDSTAIINYSNSFKKEDNEIKLLKTGGEWWVDFKYTFTGDTATEK